MYDIWVKDLMTREVVSCPPDTSLAEVVEELNTNMFSCLVVVDGDQPVGMVTERGLVQILADLLGENDWETFPIENFMSTPVITIDTDDTLIEAVETMREKNVRHVPVINTEGGLEGILTQTDVIRGFYDAMREQQPEL